MRWGLLGMAVAGCAASASTPLSKVYGTTADECTGELGYYTSGVALTDLNGDGLSDLVLSNGNDMSPQPVVVFHHTGNPTNPYDNWPDWYSGDLGYHGGLAVGDIDGNGYPDVAVAVAFGLDRRPSGGVVQVYFNHGGVLDAEPGFTTEGGKVALECALGDVDADGDLDLVVPRWSDPPTDDPIGQYHLPVPTPAEIYRNDGGKLTATPAWTTASAVGAASVAVADVDDDGWADVVLGGTSLDLHRGRKPTGTEIPIEASPSWTASTKFDLLFSLGVARRPGGVVVATSEACLLSTSCVSGFSLYDPNRGKDPVWTSDPIPSASKLLLLDLNGDRVPDLAGGQWGASTAGGPVSLYQGTPGGSVIAPPTVIGDARVRESIAAGWLGASAAPTLTEIIRITDTRSVVTLPVGQAERVVSVSVTGPGAAASYAWCWWGNEVSISPPMLPGQRVTIVYQASPVLGLAVGTWSPDMGTQIFASYLTAP